MKTSSVLIALVLLCSSLGWGAIAASNNGHTHTNGGVNTSSAPVTVTINAGDAVMVTISLNAGSSLTISSVVDSNSSDNSCFTQISSLTTTTAAQSFIWGCKSAASGGATTVTVTSSANVSASAINVETYTGVGTNGFGTQSNANLTTSATSSTLSKAVTTVDSNNFVVCAMTQQASTSPTLTASVGTLRSHDVSTSAFTVGGLNDNTAASAGSVTNTVTSDKTTNWSVACGELRSTNASVSSPTAMPVVF